MNAIISSQSCLGSLVEVLSGYPALSFLTIGVSFMLWLSWLFDLGRVGLGTPCRFAVYFTVPYLYLSC